MKSRSQSGGTLALIAVSCLVIIMIGVGFFYILQITGGEREMQHAGDSGNLNVAKQALIKPTVPLTTAVQDANFKWLTENPYGSGTTGQVDLLRYNKLAAQAYLVSLNAQVDPGPGAGPGAPSASAHSAALSTALNQVGASLQAALIANPFANDFNATAAQNSLRMLGQSSAITHQAGGYAVGYMAAGQPTNIEIPKTTATAMMSLFPALNGAPGTGMVATVSPTGVNYNGSTFVAGYKNLSVGGGPNAFAVPLLADEQPHLVGVTQFQASGVAPGQVPPNAFQSTATANQQQGLTAGSTSTAIVGALNQIYQLGDVEGYIMISNGADGLPPSTGLGVMPFIPTGVLGNELSCTGGNYNGIVTDGNVFIDNTPGNQADITAWKNFNDPAPGGMAGVGTPPPTGAFFNSSTGAPATAADLASFNSTSATTCCDINSAGSGAATPCSTGYSSGMWDSALGYATGGINQAANGLMDAECVQCSFRQKWNDWPACAGPGGGRNNCQTSGLRNYDGTVTNSNWTHTAPYYSTANSPNPGFCMVSINDTAMGLINMIANRQVSGNLLMGTQGTTAGLTAAMLTHAQMINPNLTQPQLTALLSSTTPLALGDKWYIYNQPGITPLKTIISKVPPRGLLGGAAGATAPYNLPDQANNYVFGVQYDMVNPSGNAQTNSGFINAHHDFDIHDHLYYNSGSQDSLIGSDAATFEPSSCYNHNCGRLTFTNDVKGQSCGFDFPD